MVQVTNQDLLKKDGRIDFDQWFARVTRFYSKSRIGPILGAVDLLSAYGVDEPSDHGGSCFDYGVELAAVLFNLQADEQAIAAALLFELYQHEKLTDEMVQEACGKQVMSVLQGVVQLSAFRTLQNPSPTQGQVDNFRKMLLTIVEDARIVLVKLADRVCAFRLYKNWTAHHLHVVAQEVLQIYAPLAGKLGLSTIKWELEDRAFRSLYPVVYKKIARSLQDRRLDREAYINDFVQQVDAALKEKQIVAEVTGRVKHIYSIWRKMEKKGYQLDQLYDVRAVRILVDDVDACYAVLGLIHAQWMPITQEYTDYIAHPKPNGYRSIHTIIYGPKDKTIEVQIRTHAMHEECEEGFAAHWRYKEGSKYDESYQARVSWLRSLLDFESEFHQSIGGQQEKPQQALVSDRVYAFTPQGDVQDLPQGAKVLDFAYSVHTMVGHRTRGAKVNGKIVPLTTQLHTGDQVEILTHKNPQPSRDWANPNAEYIQSAKIRNQVLRWFKQQDKDQDAIEGKEKLLHALKPYDLGKVDYDKVAQDFNVQDKQGLFAAIYQGSIRFNSVVNHIVEMYRNIPLTTDTSKTSNEMVSVNRADDRGKTASHANELIIDGVDGLMSTIAGCCKPIPGDLVGGYLTHGRGVTVHRQSCANFRRLQQQTPERVVAVNWSQLDNVTHPVALWVGSDDLHQASVLIKKLIDGQKLKLIKLKPVYGKKEQGFELVVSLTGQQQLANLMNQLQNLTGVISVQRI